MADVKITRNGKTVHYTGNVITITNGVIRINGKAVTKEDEFVVVEKIEVNGDIDMLHAEASDVVVAGDVGSVTTMSGDVECGAVKGNVSTMSGDVHCDGVGGGVSSMSGDVRTKP